MLQLYGRLSGMVATRTTVTPVGCHALLAGAALSSSAGGDRGDPRSVTSAEWRARLTPLQYQVTRLGATERPGTGRLPAADSGRYGCVCCRQPLFRPADKFESGSGWPSFHSPTDAAAVDTRVDTSLGMVRREALCSGCGAHLGHVFDDGPQPTGQRYCINAAALKVVPVESSEQK